MIAPVAVQFGAFGPTANVVGVPLVATPLTAVSASVSCEVAGEIKATRRRVSAV